MDALGGEAYTKAIASDEVQEAMAIVTGAGHVDDVTETPLGEVIDGGTEEAEAA